MFRKFSSRCANVLCFSLVLPYLELLHTVSFFHFYFYSCFFFLLVPLPGLSNPHVHATSIPDYSIKKKKVLRVTGKSLETVYFCSVHLFRFQMSLHVRLA